MNPSFDHCALHYLDQWFLQERPFHLALAAGDTAARLEALPRATQHFRISRNLPAAYDLGRGVPRLQPLLDVLDAAGEVFQDSSSPSEAVEYFRRAAGKAYGGRDLLSLSTKILWLRYRDPFIIFDSRVNTTLGLHTRSYEDFERPWRQHYEPVASQIAAASATLSAARGYAACGSTVPEADIADASSREWFHRRVFDTYLWYRGDGAPLTEE